MNTQPTRPVLWRHPPAGRVLAFAPHPDDEVAGPGGILARHRQQGDVVRVIVTTNGTNGDPDGHNDPTKYAELRRQESRAGLAILDVDDVHFWGFPDGHELTDADFERCITLAAQAIADFQPDIIYLPWERDGHPDHHALYVVVTKAIDRSANQSLALGYEVWNAMVPDVIVETTTVADQKQKAMLAHQSQIRYVQYDHALQGLNAYRSLVHLRGHGYGEALCLVRGTLPPELADPTA